MRTGYIDEARAVNADRGALRPRFSFQKTEGFTACSRILACNKGCDHEAKMQTKRREEDDYFRPELHRIFDMLAYQEFNSGK
jgi:sulfatase maturation enzyme AslB (radical SAM superfamily)